MSHLAIGENEADIKLLLARGILLFGTFYELDALHISSLVDSKTLKQAVIHTLEELCVLLAAWLAL